jgi:hypothetical protein
VRFQVLTAKNVKTDVAQCSFVKLDRSFRGAYCVCHQGDDDTVSASETSANLYETTRHNIPEDIHLLGTRMLCRFVPCYSVGINGDANLSVAHVVQFLHSMEHPFYCLQSL